MTNKVSRIDIGRVPPQAIDLEEAVLGALLIDKRGFDEIGDILIPEMFYKDQHVKIYRGILNLYSETSSVDLMTITRQLEKEGTLDEIGGVHYLIGLTQKVASSAHIERHARIIVQKYIQRRLIENSTNTIESAYDNENDVLELLDNAYSNLNEIADASIKTGDVHFSDLIDTQIERGVKIYNGEIKAGLSTPIKNLNVKTGGWRDTELIILAARPGMGKTAFALACGLHTAKQDIPVAIFSLEMSKEKLTDRIISMEAEVDGNKFNIDGLNKFDVERIERYKPILKKIPLYIDDNANLSITQFQVKAKRLKHKFGVGLIIVDYLQLMVGKGNNREQEISKISRGLKMTAKELNIPIIALSQLSRSVESRGGSKRPLLSDLRESGAIEQDADMVQFLYRPEYYGITEWEDDYDRESTDGECEYIVAKNRNGGLTRNRMKFEGRYTKFSDLIIEQSYDGVPNVNPQEIGANHFDKYEADEEFDEDALLNIKRDDDEFVPF